MTGFLSQPLTWGRAALCIAVMLFVWLGLGERAALTQHWSQIFRIDADAVVHIEGFYPRNENNQLRFADRAIVKGADRAVFEGATGVELRFERREGGRLLSLYDVRAGAGPCDVYPGLCPQTEGTLVLLIEGATGLIATASYAELQKTYIASRAPVRLIADPTVQRLYHSVNPFQADRGVQSLPRSADGEAFLLNRSAKAYFDPRAALHTSFASLAMALLAFIATSPAVNGFVARTVRTNMPLAFIFGLWTVVVYAVEFPGIFNSDTIMIDVSEDRFTDWFSSLYYVYTGVFRVLGYQWIQLPSILLFAGSFLLVLRTIDLVYADGPVRARRLLKVAFLASVMVSPAIFATMFTHQRYFLALALAVFGLCLAAFDHVHARQEPDARRPYYAAGLAALLFAGLMRPEYVVLGGLVVLAMLARILIHKRGVLISSLALGGVVAAVAIVHVGANVLLPKLYGYDSAFSALRYRGVTSVALASPFVTCDGVLSGPIEEGIETLGGVDVYCGLDPESFWWRRTAPMGEAMRLPLESFVPLVTRTVIANPGRIVANRMAVLGGILTQDYWQIASRYRMRDAARAGTPLNVHPYRADLAGVVRDRPSVEGLERAIAPAYRAISTIGPGYTLLSLAALVALLAASLMWLRAGASALLIVAILALIVPVALLAPTENWAYLAIIPVWVTFAWPLAFVESRLRRKHPVELTAREEAGRGGERGMLAMP